MNPWLTRALHLNWKLLNCRKKNRSFRFRQNMWWALHRWEKDANGRFICGVPGCSSEKSWTSSFSVWHHFNSEHADMQGTLLRGIVIWSGTAWSLVQRTWSPLHNVCFSNNFSLFQFENKNHLFAKKSWQYKFSWIENISKNPFDKLYALSSNGFLVNTL